MIRGVIGAATGGFTGGMEVPGMPKTVSTSFSRQKGTVSVNTKDNPHWHDILAYTPDGSLIKYDGMDYMPTPPDNYIKDNVTGKVKYNVCCFLKCCVKTESEARKSTHLSWKSTDGMHTISLEHHQADPFRGESPGCLSPCYPCCCLCFSDTCCKSFCQLGKVKYSQLKPETFKVMYDGEAVATLDVQPGFAKGSPAEAPVIERMTTAKAVSGSPIFVMNDVYVPEDHEERAALKCCAWSSCSCCECLKPCCCPMCMPFPGTCRCPKCSTCPCPSCNMCCHGCSWCVKCGPCCACYDCSCAGCSVFCKYVLACLTCKCCRCNVEEAIEDSSGRTPVFLAESKMHKAHRIVYRLPKTQGGQETYAWAAYTHFESPAMSHRATLTMDPKATGGFFSSSTQEAPKEVLAAIPLLIDLALGSTFGDRHEWTFSSRQFGDVFDPEEIVHYWKDGERLHSVVTNFSHGDVVNPTKGDIAPKQMTMDDEKATLIGKKSAAV